ncbi:MAG: hypothetical protein RIS00_1996 [Pseudomonadota bacterium]|jgi:hypothetical protein
MYMDWLTFISSLVGSLAWPLVVLLGLYVFRRAISDLVPSISRLKYKDLEAEFGRELEAVKKITTDIGEVKKLPDHTSAGKLNKLLTVASVAPNAAVLEAFREVEFAARSRLEKEDASPDLSTAAPYRLIQRMLEAKGILDSKGIKVFNELRTLRNKVAHAGEYEVSHEQAAEYVEISWTIVEALNSI